ncbi:hypothetical protein ACHAQH_001419 [Verticillium albo-atrum]
MFDRDTGQVFKETLIPAAPKGSESDWARRIDLPSWKGRSGKGVKGPRSFADMAMHAVAENIGFLSDDHLGRQVLPARILWRIWRLLQNRGVCFQAWKTFSKLLLVEDGEKTLDLYRYRHHICRPNQELSRYLQPLQSISVDFLSYLSINGRCAFETNELLALTELRNLAVLEIIQPADETRAIFPRVSDRLIRSWSEATDPFPFLRILRLWGDDSVSQHSLQYLDNFPSLMLYDVNGARKDWPTADVLAQHHGWKVGEPLYGLQDSLLWYLMLFEPLQEEQPMKLKELARSIDEGLLNFGQNVNQPLRFVPRADAPPFIEVLSDSARSNLSLYLDAPSYESQLCKQYPFETWAFFLYAFLGQQAKDQDAKAQGILGHEQAMSGDLLLPFKPMACLQLGHSGRAGISPAVAYVSRGLFATSRYTFYRTRKTAAAEKSKTRRPQEASGFMKPKAQHSSVETDLPLRRRKRMRMDELLDSFTRS